MDFKFLKRNRKIYHCFFYEMAWKELRTFVIWDGMRVFPLITDQCRLYTVLGPLLFVSLNSSWIVWSEAISDRRVINCVSTVSLNAERRQGSNVLMSKLFSDGSVMQFMLSKWQRFPIHNIIMMIRQISIPDIPFNKLRLLLPMSILSP